MQIDDVQVFFMGMDCQNMNGLAMYMSTYILKYFKMVWNADIKLDKLVKIKAQ